jgi:hypothetical protein
MEGAVVVDCNKSVKEVFLGMVRAMARRAGRMPDSFERDDLSDFGFAKSVLYKLHESILGLDIGIRGPSRYQEEYKERSCKILKLHILGS